MPRQAGSSTSAASGERLLAGILCAGIFFAYLLLPTRNYYWDGIGFAQTIEDASRLDSSLIHPNHLLYTAVGYVEYRFAQALGFHGRALTVLQVANSFWSALAALILFLILLRYGCSRGLSALLTLLFAFSAAWWKYSTDANAYIPATLCLLLCFRLLGPAERGKPWTVAVLHAAGMCLHQLSLIFFPVIIAGLWRQSAAPDRRRRLLACLQYGLTAFVITTTAYALAYRARQGSAGVGTFVSWISSHSPEVGFSFDVARNALLTLRGTLQLFLGGRIVSALRQPDIGTIALLGLLVAILIGLLYEIARSRSGMRSAWGRLVRCDRSPILLPALWIACYAAFLFFWLPWNTFYRLFYLPPLILLAGILLAPAMPRDHKAALRGGALFVNAVAIFNLIFYILPNAKVDSNPPLQIALQMNHEWKPGTVIYYATFVTDDWTARYFNPANSWRPLPAGGVDAINSELQSLQAGGADVWLETTALDQIAALRDGEAWLASHVVEGSRREIVNAQHRIIFQQVL